MVDRIEKDLKGKEFRVISNDKGEEIWTSVADSRYSFMRNPSGENADMNIIYPYSDNCIINCDIEGRIEDIMPVMSEPFCAIVLFKI